MSFEREGGGGGVQTAFAPMDRTTFVRSIVDEFERTHLGVHEGAVDYILTSALPPEAEWAQAVDSGRVDLARVRSALTDALEESASRTRSRGEYTVDRATVEEVFPMVIKNRWHCPYPLLLC